jgi:hypothetical protein
MEDVRLTPWSRVRTEGDANLVSSFRLYHCAICFTDGPSTRHTGARTYTLPMLLMGGSSRIE